MKRTQAREYLMQMLFQMETQNDFSEEAEDKFIELNIEEKDAKQIAYIKSVSAAFRENKNEIDADIEKYSRGWKLKRIAKVDLALMRLCISETLYLKEEDRTPEGAAINEAVKLAKKYDDEDSSRFINGILGEIFRNR